MAYGKALKEVLKKAKSKDADEAEEAAAIKKRLVDYALKQARRAKALKDDDPFRCYTLYERLTKQYQGTTLGKNIDEKRLKPLKKDKEFMALYEAGKLADQIRTHGASLKPIGNKPIDLTNKTCYKLNRTPASKMLKALKLLKKKHSDTKYYKEIVEYVSDFGISA